MPRPRRCAAVVLATVIGLSALSAAPASAHDELTSSTPAANATVLESPPEVTLRFSAALKADAVQIAVVDDGGNGVHEGAPTINGPTMTQKLRPNLPAATYRISFRVISRDGHPVSGVRSFTVQGQPGAPSTTPNTPDTAPVESASGGARNKNNNDDGRSWIWLVGGTVIVMGTLAVVLVLVRRRRDGAATPPSGT